LQRVVSDSKIAALALNSNGLAAIGNDASAHVWEAQTAANC